MLPKAIKVAKRSTIKRFKTGAVIVDRNGAIVSLGWSHMTDRRMAQYYSMHAELHAILRAEKSRLKGATMYVATIVGKSGNVTSAKPCPACEGVIASVGIKDVVFTERKVLRKKWKTRK